MSERQKKDMVNRAIGAVATLLGENLCPWKKSSPVPSDFLPTGRRDFGDI